MTADIYGQCTGKTAYASPQEAHQQVEHRKRRKARWHSAGTVAGSVYKCEICAAWHIGHDEKRRRKIRRKK